MCRYSWAATNWRKRVEQLDDNKASMQDENIGLDRREVVRMLLKDRVDMLVVTGLGSPSYDVMAAGDHDNNTISGQPWEARQRLVLGWPTPSLTEKCLSLQETERCSWG